MTAINPNVLANPADSSRRTKPLMSHQMDADRDGDLDLVFYFDVPDMLARGIYNGALLGHTIFGERFGGTASELLKKDADRGDSEVTRARPRR